MKTKKEHKRVDLRVVRKREKEVFQKGVEVPASKMTGRIVKRGWGAIRVDK